MFAENKNELLILFGSACMAFGNWFKLRRTPENF